MFEGVAFLEYVCSIQRETLTVMIVPDVRQKDSEDYLTAVFVV